MKRFLLGLVVTLLALGPVAIVVWLAGLDKHHEAVLHEYECVRNVCEVDFGGGSSGTLSVDRAVAPASEYDSWWVIADSGNELLRIPRRYIDNTLRTHVAVNSEFGRTRFVIYDHLNKQKPVNTVYAYDGRRMVEVSASEKDRLILKAMDARDDAGSFGKWVLFRVVWKPALVGYYLLLVAVGWIVRRKQLLLVIGKKVA
jgi:hypothetical protein